jgi:hypothetical protein
MLIKLLHIVAAIALAAGAFFAVHNRSQFKAARIEKSRINKEEVTPTLAKIDDRIGEIDKEIAAWSDAAKSKDQKQVAFISAQANLKSKTQDAANIEKEIADKTSDVNKLEADLQTILQGMSIDQLTQTIENLTQEVATLKTEAETQAKELELASKNVQEQQVSVGALEKSAAQRSKGISLNSFEATVIAVNPDYGFAVINAGENRGVAGDSKLIVRRGNQRVGLLNPTTIERNRTVADIVRDSIAAGYSIAPGDRVIVEKVQR